MNIYLTDILCDLQNRPIVGETGEPCTMGVVLSESLICTYQDEQNLSAKEKVERYELAKKIVTANACIQLSIEELALCKKMVNKRYGTLIVGEVNRIIENNQNTDK